MGDFGLVRMDLREREILLRIAPHLVKPLRFLVPLFGRSAFYRFKLKLGMWLYDLLSFDKSLPWHRWLTREQVEEAEPALRSDDLQGAAAYSDAQVELPERLSLENVIDAREHGALAFNYGESTAALRENGRIVGLRVRDVLSGEEAAVTRSGGGQRHRPMVRSRLATVKRIRRDTRAHHQGVHLACPPVTHHALVLFSPIDGRLFFAIPWLGYTWAGTTDTDHRRRSADAPAPRCRRGLSAGLGALFLPSLGRERIFFSNAGVRALIMGEGEESSVSREHRVVDESASGAPGLISVLGGKITGYRAIAEEVTDLVCRRLRLPARCRTAETPCRALVVCTTDQRAHPASLRKRRSPGLAVRVAGDASRRPRRGGCGAGRTAGARCSGHCCASAVRGASGAVPAGERFPAASHAARVRPRSGMCRARPRRGALGRRIQLGPRATRRGDQRLPRACGPDAGVSLRVKRPKRARNVKRSRSEGL